MPLSQAQIKGRIKNLAKTNKADARILMRIYMMERFLERLAKSVYAENFIIKGGILIRKSIGRAFSNNYCYVYNEYSRICEKTNPIQSATYCFDIEAIDI